MATHGGGLTRDQAHPIPMDIVDHDMHRDVCIERDTPRHSRKVRVAFQGERGAYGDDAIADRWRGDAIPVPAWSFADVIRAVMSGGVDYGVLPVDNTVVGPIAATREALAAAPALVVLDHIVVPIRHALLAPRAATLDGLTSVTSHPVALAQCGAFLARHPHLYPYDSYDTAGAARDVAARNDPTESAIASVAAAARYKLRVMAEDIQDAPENTTRFVVIARRVSITPITATSAMSTTARAVTVTPAAVVRGDQ